MAHDTLPALNVPDKGQDTTTGPYTPEAPTDLAGVKLTPAEAAVIAAMRGSTPDSPSSGETVAIVPTKQEITDADAALAAERTVEIPVPSVDGSAAAETAVPIYKKRWFKITGSVVTAAAGVVFVASRGTSGTSRFPENNLAPPVASAPAVPGEGDPTPANPDDVASGVDGQEGGTPEDTAGVFPEKFDFRNATIDGDPAILTTAPDKIGQTYTQDAVLQATWALIASNADALVRDGGPGIGQLDKIFKNTTDGYQNPGDQYTELGPQGVIDLFNLVIAAARAQSDPATAANIISAFFASPDNPVLQSAIDQIMATGDASGLKPFVYGGEASEQMMAVFPPDPVEGVTQPNEAGGNTADIVIMYITDPETGNTTTLCVTMRPVEMWVLGPSGASNQFMAWLPAVAGFQDGKSGEVTTTNQPFVGEATLGGMAENLPKYSLVN